MATGKPLQDPASATADGEDEGILWRRWREARDQEARQELLELHLPYARIIAAQVYAKRSHDEFEFDEYLQFATVALIESLERYDPGLGAQFRTYAHSRMRGAILSGIEHLSDRQQQMAVRRRLKSDRLTLAGESAAPAAGQPDQLFHYLADVGIGLALGVMLEGSTLLMNEDHWIPDQAYERAEVKQLTKRVRELTKQLTERESQVIRWHYLQSMSFDEIARKLNISNGRVSQLHYQGLQRLRRLLTSGACCDVAW